MARKSKMSSKCQFCGQLECLISKMSFRFECGYQRKVAEVIQADGKETVTQKVYRRASLNADGL